MAHFIQLHIFVTLKSLSYIIFSLYPMKRMPCSIDNNFLTMLDTYIFKITSRQWPHPMPTKKEEEQVPRTTALEITRLLVQVQQVRNQNFIRNSIHSGCNPCHMFLYWSSGGLPLGPHYFLLLLGVNNHHRDKHVIHWRIPLCSIVAIISR